MKLLCSIIILLFISSCQFFEKEVAPLVYQGQALGWDYKVSYLSGPTSPGPQALAAESAKLSEDYGAEFSHNLPTSFISQFNLSTSLQPQRVSQRGLEFMLTAREVWGATSGAYDPTSAPLIALWRKSRAKKEKRPTPTEIKELLTHQGLEKVKVDHQASTWQKTSPETVLDVGHLAPAHLLDLIGEQLNKRDVKSFFIHLDGLYLARGKRGAKSWQVETQECARPKPGAALLEFPLEDEALVILSDGTGPHTMLTDPPIDPRIGEEPQHKLRSVIVIAKTAREAQAWAIGLRVLGPRVIEAQHELAKLLDAKQVKVFMCGQGVDGKLELHMNGAMKKLVDQ